MTTTCTPYGDVTITPHGVVIEAHAGQLGAWARKPSASWPCSYLDDLNDIRAHFDAHGLVDLDSSSDEPTGERELPADELSAWSSDVLRDVLPADHPAYFVTVGQYS
jgi:hypothetical protein